MLIQSLPSFATSRVREAGRATGELFRVVERSEVRRPNGGPGSTAALASLHTLLALQQVEPDPQERRRRAVRRGGQLLDALEDVQLDLLAGSDPARGLARLRASLPDEPAGVEADLARVLEEIEVRAAVELAKRERDGGG